MANNAHQYVSQSKMLPDTLVSLYCAQFMGYVIGRIHYGRQVVFCYSLFTASHDHHNARLLTGIEHV